MVIRIRCVSNAITMFAKYTAADVENIESRHFSEDSFVNIKIMRSFVGIGHMDRPHMKFVSYKFNWDVTTVANTTLLTSRIGMSVTSLLKNIKTKNGLILVGRYYKNKSQEVKLWKLFMTKNANSILFH